tara:strand:+ start:149 stop:1090 length:942 start_codon:yes stop_codon:yes gene_type:complete
MKKLHIAVYVMPWEVDEFFGLCNRLKMASKYVKDRSNEILLDVTLNLSSKLIDWKNSKIPKELLEDRFNHALQLCDWCELKSNIVTLEGEFGCNDKRRNVIKETEAEFVCFVDSDIVFNETALYYILQSIDISSNTPYVIISQELPRMWDDSWDSIVAEKYRNLPYKGDEHYINFDFTEIDIPEDINIEVNDTIKFSGGFLTTISSKLAKDIGIPESLGSYKLDDTFLLFCSYEIAKALGFNYIKQYVLRGLTITEDRKYQNQTLKKYLTMDSQYIRDRKTIEKLGAEDPIFVKEMENFCVNKIPEIVKKYIK